MDGHYLDQWLLIDMNNEGKMPPAWDEYLEEIPPVWCKSSKPKEVGSNSRLKTSGLEWNDQTNNAINVYSVTHSGQEREEHKRAMTNDMTEDVSHLTGKEKEEEKKAVKSVRGNKNCSRNLEKHQREVQGPLCYANSVDGDFGTKVEQNYKDEVTARLKDIEQNEGERKMKKQMKNYVIKSGKLMESDKVKTEENSKEKVDATSVLNHPHNELKSAHAKKFRKTTWRDIKDDIHLFYGLKEDDNFKSWEDMTIRLMKIGYNENEAKEEIECIQSRPILMDRTNAEFEQRVHGEMLMNLRIQSPERGDMIKSPPLIRRHDLIVVEGESEEENKPKRINFIDNNIYNKSNQSYLSNKEMYDEIKGEQRRQELIKYKTRDCKSPTGKLTRKRENSIYKMERPHEEARETKETKMKHHGINEPEKEIYICNLDDGEEEPMDKDMEETEEEYEYEWLEEKAMKENYWNELNHEQRDRLKNKSLVINPIDKEIYICSWDDNEKGSMESFREEIEEVDKEYEEEDEYIIIEGEGNVVRESFWNQLNDRLKDRVRNEPLESIDFTETETDKIERARKLEKQKENIKTKEDHELTWEEWEMKYINGNELVLGQKAAYERKLPEEQFDEANEFVETKVDESLQAESNKMVTWNKIDKELTDNFNDYQRECKDMMMKVGKMEEKAEMIMMKEEKQRRNEERSNSNDQKGEKAQEGNLLEINVVLIEESGKICTWTRIKEKLIGIYGRMYRNKAELRQWLDLEFGVGGTEHILQTYMNEINSEKLTRQKREFNEIGTLNLEEEGRINAFMDEVLKLNVQMRNIHDAYVQPIKKFRNKGQENQTVPIVKQPKAQKKQNTTCCLMGHDGKLCVQRKINKKHNTKSSSEMELTDYYNWEKVQDNIEECYNRRFPGRSDLNKWIVKHYESNEVPKEDMNDKTQNKGYKGHKITNRDLWEEAWQVAQKMEWKSLQATVKN